MQPTAVDFISIESKSNQTASLLVLCVVLFAIVLAIACVNVAVAQTMPTFPAAYFTGYTTQTSGQPAVSGNLYVANLNKTRSDVITTAYKASTWYFVQNNVAKTWTSYSYSGGPATCINNTSPYVPPAPTSGCVGPTYAGQATVNGVVCQHWTVNCTYTSPYAYSASSDMYWNANTPVQVISYVSLTGSTTTMTYTGFNASPPDPSEFTLPSNCPQVSRLARRVGTIVRDWRFVHFQALHHQRLAALKN